MGKEPNWLEECVFAYVTFEIALAAITVLVVFVAWICQV
jgi:hypothetical protein